VSGLFREREIWPEVTLFVILRIFSAKVVMVLGVRVNVLIMTDTLPVAITEKI
jgi:hypothetical protein